MHLIAAILERQPPPITQLQPLTPPGLERVVRACLAKAPEDRWQHAGDIARQLAWLATESESGAVALTSGAIPAAAKTAPRRPFCWMKARAVSTMPRLERKFSCSLICVTSLYLAPNFRIASTVLPRHW